MKKALLFLSVLTGLTLVAVGVVIFLLNPVSATPQDQAFVVNKGDGIRLISRRLKQNGLIKNDQVFLAYAYFVGLHNRLQAGSFKLSPHLSTPQLIDRLSRPGRSEYWIKILEGWRNKEISDYLAKNNIVNPDGFRLKTAGLEGKLFPDSYLVPQDYQLDQILELINNNFQNKLTQAKQLTSTSAPYTDDQMIILASLVEREARTPKSKSMVAGVLLNRLQIGMPLQVDATVQYARDSLLPDGSSYWQPVTKADLAIDSPYNTYQIPGLPPGAICNPGYDSLYAVYHPDSHDYLYYITGNDNQMHYAVTLEEHNANIDRYLR